MLGKVALITGSTAGIGLGMARHLAERGCSVIFTGLEKQSVKDDILHRFRRTYKGEYHLVDADLRYKDDVTAMCKSVTQLFPGGIDVLVNNAGFQYVCPVEDFPVNKWDDMVAIQLTAAFLLIRHFLPDMKTKGWGRIVNISSVMGLVSQPGKVPYSTMKSGLIGMTRGVALESAPFGVTCNAVCPGFIETELIKKQILTHGQQQGLQDYEKAKASFFADKHPSLQPVTFDQVSSLVTYLCSDVAASITGSAIPVEGGHVAR